MIIEKICLFKSETDLPLSLLSYNVTCYSELWMYLIVFLMVAGVYFLMSDLIPIVFNKD